MGATKNNTGGHLKMRGYWENSNMRGHTKFLGGLKIEGARLSGGLLQRGVGEGCAVRGENVQYQNCYICSRRTGCGVRRKSALSGMSHV